MGSGLVLIAVGAALWLVVYFVPSRMNWSDAIGGRNRVGETLARVLGPALVAIGVVAVVADLIG